MNRILVCASNRRERDRLMRAAEQDGARLEPAKHRAYFDQLEIELRFEILDSERDADRLQGLELAGAVNFRAVSNDQCRTMIYARWRP